MNREDGRVLLGYLVEALVKRRKELGLTQKEVAKRMQVTQSHISDMESGELEFTVPTLFRYLDALDMQLSLIDAQRRAT
jgi:predicted transcriptional regulator